MKFETSISHNQFMVIRGLICMAHADGILHEVEKEYLRDFLDQFELNEMQVETLERDLDHPANIDGILKAIEESNYHEQLIEHAKELIIADGTIDPKERLLIQKLTAYLKEFNKKVTS